MTFQDKLDKLINKNNSLICVGLDSSLEKTHSSINKKRYPLFEFNKVIIEATADLVCAYKPNSAFYEAEGAWGIEQLKMTCDFLKKNYSEVPIILDAKRADIGSTNEGYVKYAFDYLGADAITLHPYLGKEALAPFLEKKDKGFFILCKTSNPGASELQNLIVGKKPIYQIIAQKVIKDWNKNNNCMLVVGATYPKELNIIRKIIGKMTLLVPGVGAQGGSIKEVVINGQNNQGQGLIINISRSIIYSKNPEKETEKFRQEVNYYRKK